MTEPVTGLRKESGRCSSRFFLSHHLRKIPTPFRGFRTEARRCGLDMDCALCQKRCLRHLSFPSSRNTVQIRGGPAAVIGDEGAQRFEGSNRSLSGTTPRGRPHLFRGSESQKTCWKTRSRVTDGKGSPEQIGNHADWLRAFSLVRDRDAKTPGEQRRRTMQKVKRIVSYRRRCRKLGDSTGLSHYILLTPTPKEKQEK